MNVFTERLRLAADALEQEHVDTLMAPWVALVGPNWAEES